jgi:hypothetical protein
MPDWIERRDYDLEAQSAAFSNAISSDPLAYGATPEQAAELVERRTRFVELLHATSLSSGNSSSATFAKILARQSLCELMRSMGRVVRAMPSVLPIQREAMAMPVPQPRRRRGVPRPVHTPRIELSPPRQRSFVMRVRSLLTPETRGLPRDVKVIVVSVWVGENPDTSLAGWHRIAWSSKAKFTVHLLLPDVKIGDKVWFVAQYANGKAEAGPPSSAVYGYADAAPVSRPNHARVPGRAA